MMTERQAHAFAHPIHNPAESSRGFSHTKRVADGVMITILTVNR